MIAFISSPIQVVLFVLGMVNPAFIANTPHASKECTTSIVYNMEVAFTKDNLTKSRDNIKGQLEICVNNDGDCQWQVQTKKKHRQKFEAIAHIESLFDEINDIIQVSLQSKRGHLDRYLVHLKQNGTLIKDIKGGTLTFHKTTNDNLEIITLFDKKTNKVIGSSILKEGKVLSKLLCIYDYKGNIMSPSRVHIHIPVDNAPPLDIDVHLLNERVESL